jgi:hypothetical protein
VIARKNGARVKLYSRPRNDLTRRFPLIAEALARLRALSCVIDGEAVVCGDDGIACFERIRQRRHDESVFRYGPSIWWSSTAKTCDAIRSRCARQRSPACSRARRWGCARCRTAHGRIFNCLLHQIY